MRDRISTVIDRTITDPFVQQFANDADQSPTVMQFCIGMIKTMKDKPTTRKLKYRTRGTFAKFAKKKVAGCGQKKTTKLRKAACGTKRAGGQLTYICAHTTKSGRRVRAHCRRLPGAGPTGGG